MALNKTKIRIILLGIALIIIGAAAALFILDCRDFFYSEDKYDDMIKKAAARHDVDSMLIKAVIAQESVFNHKCVGGKGEIGLMQLLPGGAVADWAKHHQRKPPVTGALFDPELNIEIGTWYLKTALECWKDYEHGTELALCQYNAGPSRAEKWKPDNLSGEVIDRITIGSTKVYVTRIMKKYQDYKDAQKNH